MLRLRAGKLSQIIRVSAIEIEMRTDAVFRGMPEAVFQLIQVITAFIDKQRPP